MYHKKSLILFSILIFWRTWYNSLKNNCLVVVNGAGLQCLVLIETTLKALLGLSLPQYGLPQLVRSEASLDNYDNLTETN